jgi:hypothetical protein
MRFAGLAVAWALLAAPALAEQYNIVCPVQAMGTAQAGGATVARGYIFSLDLDGGKGCERTTNQCAAVSLNDAVATLSFESGLVAEFNTTNDRLAVTLPERDGAVRQEGTCRRAPFQPLP